MPITWRNIGAPETYSGNQLMNQGINHMNTGMGQLTAFGQQEQQNNIQQQQAFETEQANVFQQQLKAMDDQEVMALQEQFQSNPEAAIQQFGGQAETVFNALQQEPARREEQANAEFQREQQTMARTTAPILDRGTNLLSAYRMDPTNPENITGLNSTIEELETMGAYRQATELRNQKIQAMDDTQREQYQTNVRNVQSRINELDQKLLNGDISQGDYVKSYDSLTEQYGSDAVSSVAPIAEFNQRAEQLAVQAGKMSVEQAAQVSGFREEAEYLIGRVNEEHEIELDRIERLAPDNYYVSLNDEARQAEDTGAVTRNWQTQLEGYGISQDNAQEYARYAQEQAQRIYSERLKEQGIAHLPGTFVQRALNNANLNVRDWQWLGNQDQNKSAIVAALEQEAVNYLQAERISEQKHEANKQHRRTLQAFREELKQVNGRLSSHVSGDLNAQITPELMQEVLGETEVLGRIFGRYQPIAPSLEGEQQVPQLVQDQPERDPFDMLIQAQRMGQATPQMQQDIAQQLGLDLATQEQVVGTSPNQPQQGRGGLIGAGASVGQNLLDVFSESAQNRATRGAFMAWMRANNIAVSPENIQDERLFEQFLSQQ